MSQFLHFCLYTCVNVMLMAKQTALKFSQLFVFPLFHQASIFFLSQFFRCALDQSALDAGMKLIFSTQHKTANNKICQCFNSRSKVLPCPSLFRFPRRVPSSWLWGLPLAWASGIIRATSSHRVATTSHHLIPAKQHRPGSGCLTETSTRVFDSSVDTVHVGASIVLNVFEIPIAARFSMLSATKICS